MSRQGVQYALWMLFTVGVVLALVGLATVLLTARLVTAALLLPIAIVLIVFSILMIRSEKKNATSL